VKAAHLDDRAGVPMAMSPPPSATPTGNTMSATNPLPTAGASAGNGDEAAAIVSALERERGNVTRAAQALGMHRTQLRRWLAQHQIDPRQYRRRLGSVADSSDSGD
jgi:DNA-binding NtrC family response regulator